MHPFYPESALYNLQIARLRGKLEYLSMTWNFETYFFNHMLFTDNLRNREHSQQIGIGLKSLWDPPRVPYFPCFRHSDFDMLVGNILCVVVESIENFLFMGMFISWGQITTIFKSKDMYLE